jgi:hypothetical protein
MPVYHKIHILFFLFLIAAAGCSDKTKTSEQTKNNSGAQDTSSAVIKYSITGTGNGAITITKYRAYLRVDLEKYLSEGIGKESRFISDGYVYFYLSTGNLLQPVKSKVVKDNNYPKSFSAFTDAGEFIPRMKKSGTDMVSGYLCDVYTDISDGSSFSVFGSRYVLKAVFGGNIIMANSVEINAAVDSNYVKAPLNVDFRDITQ